MGSEDSVNTSAGSSTNSVLSRTGSSSSGASVFSVCFTLSSGAVVFSGTDDEGDVMKAVVEFSPLSKADVVGCDAEGTCWFDASDRRNDRFGLRVHSAKRCMHRSCGCTSEGGYGLCTSGGKLASEIGIQISDVFLAWRMHAGIPSTVPAHVQNRGRFWGPRREPTSSRRW